MTGYALRLPFFGAKRGYHLVGLADFAHRFFLLHGPEWAKTLAFMSNSILPVGLRKAFGRPSELVLQIIGIY
jgi:hypothetical protein